jgi:hypothetical protein
MIATFQESSWGTTEIARPAGHSQMSSISILIADSSCSRVFAGFFKLVPSPRTRSTPLAIRERKRRGALAIRYWCAVHGRWSSRQGNRRHNVPRRDHFAGGLSGLSAHLRAAGSCNGSSQLAQTYRSRPFSSATSFIGLPHEGHAFRIGCRAVILDFPAAGSLAPRQPRIQSLLQKVAFGGHVPVRSGSLTAAVRVYRMSVSVALAG